MIIEDLYANGHVSVEDLVLKFLTKLQGLASDPWFELSADVVISEGYHAERQIIGAEIELEIETAYDLE